LKEANWEFAVVLPEVSGSFGELINLDEDRVRDTNETGGPDWITHFMCSCLSIDVPSVVAEGLLVFIGEEVLKAFAKGLKKAWQMFGSEWGNIERHKIPYLIFSWHPRKNVETTIIYDYQNVLPEDVDNAMESLNKSLPRTQKRILEVLPMMSTKSLAVVLSWDEEEKVWVIDSFRNLESKWNVIGYSRISE
jgi:hypothetical protein